MNVEWCSIVRFRNCILRRNGQLEGALPNGDNAHRSTICSCDFQPVFSGEIGSIHCITNTDGGDQSPRKCLCPCEFIYRSNMATAVWRKVKPVHQVAAGIFHRRLLTAGTADCRRRNQRRHQTCLIVLKAAQSLVSLSNMLIYCLKVFPWRAPKRAAASRE